MSPVDVVRAFVTEVWSEGRLERIPDLVHDDYADGELVVGPGFVRDNVTTWRTAFPDLQCTVLTSCSEGPLVAVLVRMTGTHLGPWEHVPATGRNVDIREAIFWTVRDGRLATIQSVGQSLKFRIQLGLLPEDA
jgi:predicted ester cyclase